MTRYSPELVRAVVAYAAACAVVGEIARSGSDHPPAELPPVAEPRRPEPARDPLDEDTARFGSRMTAH